MNLTALQLELLCALDDEHPNSVRVGRDSDFSATVARSLERRGIVNIERDECGDLRVTWDDESHADWLRQAQRNFDRVLL